MLACFLDRYSWCKREERKGPGYLPELLASPLIPTSSTLTRTDTQLGLADRRYTCSGLCLAGLERADALSAMQVATLNDGLQHAPLALYLVAVAALSLHLFPRVRNIRSGIFILGALGSLGVTWTYMFKYMQTSYQDHRASAGLSGSISTTRWLEETSLFDQAWRYVCRTPERWWFSSQLCLFTVGVFTVFLYAEGTELLILEW